ncbi:BAR adaptor protein Hob1 [Collariella sp. IMI 366227]|nr:BAR adaptor protein Hob1 [Collariella sp. IMI 366227]
MSFKGLSKGLARAPQQFKVKFNIGEHTKDAVYIDSERRFQELETETKRLHDESKRYFDAINGMLHHQIEFSQAMTEIYKPISGRVSDPDSLEVVGNPEGIRACEEYEAVVKDLQETLAPELEMIESRVIRPANELLDVIKVIRKTATKREHKKLDYDRHRATLKKLQDKKDKTAKDEKAMWKAEGEVEQSTQEFNYFNDLLKEELPRLFALEREFIQPLFQSFYYMQLNIFYTLHERMQQVDIGYFDLTLDVEDAFLRKRGDVQEQAEALSICRFKTTGQKRPPKHLLRRPSIITNNTSDRHRRLALLQIPAVSALRPTWRQSEASENPPLPYSPPLSSPGNKALAAAVAAKSKPPPPPKPKPSRLSAAPKVETVTALYDYSAQAEGDLSFRAGDVIEVLTRTANDNEWWTGSVGGKQGQFPGEFISSL